MSSDTSSFGRTATRAITDVGVFTGGLLLTGNPVAAFEAAQTADKVVQLIPDNWFGGGVRDAISRDTAGLMDGTTVPSVHHRFILPAVGGGYQRGRPVPGAMPPIGGGLTRHMADNLSGLGLYGPSPPAVDLFGFAQARASGLPYTPPERIGVQVPANIRAR